uniref:ORF61 n=2 Tax=Nitrosopumilaceae spindle-shaped virus TaxID=3065433 RepID=A0AAT9J9E4_9VIRU
MSIFDLLVDVAVASAIIKTTKKLSDDTKESDNSKYEALGVKD